MAKDAYRRLAGVYDRVVEPAASALRRQSVRLFPPQENLSILDVGCGTGTQLALYDLPGCKLSGIDLSPSMVARARAKLGAAADIRCEDASQMSFPSEAFDLVMVVTVLHELPTGLRAPVLEECLRVVKRSGRVMLVDYHTGPYAFPRGRIWKTVITLLELLAGRTHFSAYRDFMARGGLDGPVQAFEARIATRVIPPSGTAALYLLEPAPVAVAPHALPVV